jgi:hypothetical protein
VAAIINAGSHSELLCQRRIDAISAVRAREISLRILWRTLITVVAILAVAFAAVTWIAPLAVSYSLARNAPPVARVVPANLRDLSVSQTPGKRLSYFGYEFEIPWDDLDETQTKLYPQDKPCKAALFFRSGLQLIVTALPPREWVNGFAAQMKVPPERIQSTFGQSDYSFVKRLYEFTPDKMNHWASLRRGVSQDEFLLLIKAKALGPAAQTGIFYVENASYKGFQQGNPQVRQDGIVVHLFTGEGSIEFIFLQRDYRAGLKQSEINRIVQSLHETAPDQPSSHQIAAN